MKISKLFTLIVVLLTFTECHVINKKHAQSKTMSIQCSEIYCGGAAPPDDLLMEMAKIKPMLHRDVEVFFKKDIHSKSFKYKTNALGEFTISIGNKKKIFINIYPSADAFKVDAKEYECYKAFILENLIEVQLSKGKNKYELTSVIKCNPCIPAIP
jgi:hypothetical protein